MTKNGFHWQWLLLLHWAARVLSLAVVVLVAFFFIGEGGFNPATLTPRESLLMFFFLMTCIGLIVAWYREALGGGMAILSMALFYMANWVFTGRFPRGWAFVAILLPAFLFLFCNLFHAGRYHNKVA